MCGIAGIYHFKFFSPPYTEVLYKMLKVLSHRGPDDRGVYFSADKRLGLGHCRLSIIDLSSLGHQPMSNLSQTIWLAHNGEIYNYQQLRNELKEAGYSFVSCADTEVIIYGYQHWGIEGLLKRLKGMFAFALYDCQSKPCRLILARDRFGIKPLYYYQSGELIAFASEVKAISASGLAPFKKNDKAKINFLVLGSIPEPMSTLKDVFLLPAGTYMSVEGNQARIVRYYELLDSFSQPKLNLSNVNVYEDLRQKLEELIDLYLISDAPLGVFLSGGLDSSALVALAARSKLRSKPLVTLSVIFEEKEFSEDLYQKIISQKYNTEHYALKITSKDFYREIDNILDAMDQPTVDGINTYFVSQAAKKTGLKAVLSGLGADEVFCGYPWFKKIRWLKKIYRSGKFLGYFWDLIGSLNIRSQKLSYFKGDLLGLYLGLRGLFSPAQIAKLLEIDRKEIEMEIQKIGSLCQRSDIKKLDPIDWLSYMEINFYLKNQLLKDTDFMSMYHALETRVPYLEHSLVEYIARIDADLKIKPNTPKPLLAKSLKDILPTEIIFKRKQGFVFPWQVWFKKDGRGFLEEGLSNLSLNKKYVFALWQKFQEGRLHWSRIWALYVAGKKI